jgi:DNA-directed RNA polymerase subunit RPC12/RpoP
MGSVIDYIECPNCGQEAYDDFYYKTGEEYINCQNCGYHRSATIINRNKALNELTDEDWEIHELKNPYGAYQIRCYDSIGYECGSLESEEDFVTLLANLREQDSVETFTVSRLIDGEIRLILAIDNGPKVDGAGFSEEDRMAK